MADIRKAVALILQIARDDSHGYDQQNRNGPDYDCSSLVSTVLHEAGYKISPNSWTGNMRAQLLADGWQECSAPWQAGDVHLDDQNHVAMSVSPDKIVEASLNEKGGITGGQTGDQTGREIWERPYYSYPWKVHLRPPQEAPSYPDETHLELEDVARQVIAGRYGVEPERSSALRRAGYDPMQVQLMVNTLLGVKVDDIPVDYGQVARDVIAGKYGNYPQRVDNLRNAGYDPYAVQELVNKMLRA